VLMTQVGSERSDSLASRGSLHSSEEVAAAVSSRPTDSSEVTSFSIRKPVSHNSSPVPA